MVNPIMADGIKRVAMNSEKRDGGEVERKEMIENKRIHGKTREKRKKDWKENQRERERINGRNRSMHQ